MKPRYAIPAICFAAVLVAALFWWHGGRGNDTRRIANSPNRNTHSVEPISATPQEHLGAVVEELRAMAKTDAVARITAILASGRDYETGAEFTLDADGNLTAAPTLRTRLLDELAAIDPAVAARVSRDILTTPTTADEWAIALRNVARVDETSRDYLRSKAEELIRNPEWQAAPSIGYLNAFDVLVHTEAIESTPLLSTLVQNKGRRDLAHAAFLALDCLVQRQPVEMLRQLGADTALQKSRPEMTAQQFARADLRDPMQREIVEAWLLAPHRNSTELNAFAGVFPNHNQFVSNKLLTRDIPVSGADLAAHDREVLAIIAAWQSTPAFESVASTLTAMTARLAHFNGQQPQNGP